MPNGPVFNVSSVVEGQSVTVTILGAACEQVLVRFYVGGVFVDEADASVTSPAVFNCPPDVQGEAWVVEVFCPGGPVELEEGVVG